MYVINSGLSYTILRLPNVYGPRQDTEGEGGVIAIFCQELVKKKQCIINNTGRQTRDFIYVDDIVAASLKVLANGTNHNLNISTNKETSINSLYNDLVQIAGFSIQPKRGAYLEEQLKSALSNKLANRVLKWQPKTTIKHGLTQTFKWFKNENKKNN